MIIAIVFLIFVVTISVGVIVKILVIDSKTMCDSCKYLRIKNKDSGRFKYLCGNENVPFGKFNKGPSFCSYYCIRDNHTKEDENN